MGHRIKIKFKNRDILSTDPAEKRESARTLLSTQQKNIQTHTNSVLAVGGKDV